MSSFADCRIGVSNRYIIFCKRSCKSGMSFIVRDLTNQGCQNCPYNWSVYPQNGKKYPVLFQIKLHYILAHRANTRQTLNTSVEWHVPDTQHIWTELWTTFWNTFRPLKCQCSVDHVKGHIICGIGLNPSWLCDICFDIMVVEGIN